MSKRILVVDDAPIIRLMLSDILKFNNYEVVGEGCNGQEGVDKYKELKPDLVTMDIVMPEKDGIQAMTEILEFDKNAKVVMVTAIDQRESLMKAIRAGATDYIIKPFEQDRVLSAIKKAFGEA
ncbi:MAG: response regulator [Candidatus Omnitrophica bacterium]|nr:response regulator [Candidatus Omnitrophota bacterium]MCB9748126.1 response regulator [Candidatus Omnitrophota bacterium]